MRQHLLDFVKQQKDTDIFCFQEVYHQAENKMSAEDKASPNIFMELQQILPEHAAFFRPALEDWYGLGIFAKKSATVLEEGEMLIYANPDYQKYASNHSRNLQWVKCKAGKKTYSIINVHGLWTGTGAGKTDTPERILQSQNIKNFVSTLNDPKVLCGDFNLRPDTQSVQILEENMVNLIKKYDIKSTRTSFYEKSEKFADYTFVSPDIKVNQFRILPDEVSDHAAMYLDFK